MTTAAHEGHTTRRHGRAGLLQTDAEWQRRNEVLFDQLRALIERFATFELGRGLDVGCQTGDLTDLLATKVGHSWWGIDPALEAATQAPHGAPLLPGTAHALPFDDGYFDCLVFANVFEHIEPADYSRSFREMYRVLRPGGVIVGQIPNPHFPIESHSRLPFMGWLPPAVQRRYWRLSPVSWPLDFYSVTIRDLDRVARSAGLPLEFKRNFNYPLDVVPRAVRPLARMMQLPMRVVPWSWQFVLRRPTTSTSSIG